jgi:uncharacterized membrane protein
MKKTLALSALSLCVNVSSFACPLCNKQIRDVIYNSQFYPNLFIMLSAFIVLLVIVVIMTAITNKRHKTWLATNPDATALSPVPLTTASIVLGIGFGGFVDGILFHQILQVHEMLSNKIATTSYIGKSVNMFWDGIFHAFCLIVSIVGLILLWKLMLRNDVDRSGNLLAAGLLFGWGIFNLVEGIIDHQLLKLHNVIEYANNHTVANYAFLAISVAMIIIGWILVRHTHRKRYTLYVKITQK